MTEKNDQDPPRSDPSRPTSRGVNIYDKIAQARERRAEALSGDSRAEPGAKPGLGGRGAPPLGRKPKTSSASVPRTSKAPPPLPPPDDAVDEEDATEVAAALPAENAEKRPRATRGPMLWVLSTVVAAAAIVLVAWSSRPAATIPRAEPSPPPVAETTAEQPAPEVAVPPAPDESGAEPILFDGSPALPEPENSAIAAPPARPGGDEAPPIRVAFDPMPRTPPADPLPGVEAPIFIPDRDLRVVLNAPRTVSDDRLAGVVEALTAGGVQPRAQRVNMNISTANVRYFHPGDAEAAAIMAEGIGALLRDFTDFEPKPPEGLIEIWLAGREVGGSGGGGAPAQRGGALDQIGADLRRLEQGLRRALGGN